MNLREKVEAARGLSRQFQAVIDLIAEIDSVAAIQQMASEAESRLSLAQGAEKAHQDTLDAMGRSLAAAKAEVSAEKDKAKDIARSAKAQAETVIAAAGERADSIVADAQERASLALSGASERLSKVSSDLDARRGEFEAVSSSLAERQAELDALNEQLRKVKAAIGALV